MNHELLVRFGDIEWTLAHYDAAYQSLRSSNFLKLQPGCTREADKLLTHRPALRQNEHVPPYLQRNRWKVCLKLSCVCEQPNLGQLGLGANEPVFISPEVSY